MTRFVEILRAAVDWTLRFPLGRSQWIVLALWSLVLAGGMVEFGDRIASTTNVDTESYDQGAYVRVAEQNRPAWWPTATDGIRNPLFPWLLAKVGSSSAESMFSTGLRLNVRLGAVLVLLFAYWAGRRLSWFPAITFTTIAAAIVLPISTYVGTEVLFYGLFFAAWMLAFDLFQRLTFLRSALFGATLGFAYLAKPGVTLLAGCFVLVGLALWFHSRRIDNPSGWNSFRPVVGAVLATAIFAVMILPRALSAWQQFRDPLQNTAMRCFWADDWSMCYPILGNLNPRFIERIPPEDRPTASRYLSRHGWSGAWKRLREGIDVQADNVFSVDQKNLWFDRRPSAKRPVRRIFPYRGYLLIPPVALVIGFYLAARGRSSGNDIAPATMAQLAFTVLLVGLTFGAYSWYSVIAPGARFIIALYLPLLGTLLFAAEALRRRMATRWSDYTAAGTWLLMFTLMTTHLVLIVTHPYFDKLKGAF